MFIKGIAFKFQLEFFEANKANCNLSLKDVDREGLYPLEPNTLVGTAAYGAGFPLTYEVHPSLTLDERRRRICEEIIHNGIAVWIPLEFSRRGIHTIQFTPAFPSYVGLHSPWYRMALAEHSIF